MNLWRFVLFHPAIRSPRNKPLLPTRHYLLLEIIRSESAGRNFFPLRKKKALAAAVKARPVIWDLADAEHYNNNAIKLAWKQIGSELSRTPGNCKTAWIALRESHRYRKNVAMKKSGSDGGVPIPRPPSDVEWEFAEDLAFLPDISRKRKTMTTAKDDSLVVDEERSEPTLEPTGSSSNYFYQTGPSKNTKEDEAVTFLATNINHLISVQRSSIAQPASAEDDQIKHKTALTNIDRMLQKLPDDVVEDVLFDFTSLVYRKIREYRPQPF